QGVDLQTVLELVARRARELVQAETATIAIPEDGSGVLVVRVADGTHAAALQGMTFPADESISGEVIRTERTVVLDDASTDGRVFQPFVQAAAIGPAMFIPLIRQGRAFGTLAVGRDVGGNPFPRQDVELIEIFASQ